MPKKIDRTEAAKAKCKACGGTGKSSRGGPCEPCLARRERELKRNMEAAKK